MKSRNEFPTDESYRQYLKTYFAAKAMHGLLAQAHDEHPQTYDMEKWNYEVIAKCSIKAADELLKQLESK